MNAKSILIPIAAFAVTVTGASAFNSDVLERAGLDKDQIDAFEEARSLREAGDKDKARDVLLDAGIDQDTIDQLREAMREARKENHDAVKEAVEANDYGAFLLAIEDTPLVDIITSKDDFDLFVEAHKLMDEGQRKEAEAILTELGFDNKNSEHKFHGMEGMMNGGRKIENASFWNDLDRGVQNEIKSAIKNKDFKEVDSLLEKAGIDVPDRHEHRGRVGGRDSEDEG